MSERVLSLPPLMSAQEIAPPGDPICHACALARAGCDSGLMVHAIAVDRLRAALVLVPEVPLQKAAQMLPVCGLAFQNAFGSLAPPDVALLLGWDGRIMLNGARCGTLEIASDTTDPDAVPQWLVIGLDLTLMSFSDAPGETPEITALDEEGCGDIDAGDLLEAWARHCLLRINEWGDGGLRHLHREWETILHGTGTEMTLVGQTVTLLGIDADFAALLKNGETALVPLSALVNRREQ